LSGFGIPNPAVILSVPSFQYDTEAVMVLICTAALGPVWQGSGSSKNNSGSGSSDGAASLVELEPF